MASFSSSPSLSLTNTRLPWQDHFIIVVVKSKHNINIFFIVVVVEKRIIRGKCETLTNDQGMRTDLMPHRWYFSRKHYTLYSKQLLSMIFFTQVQYYCCLVQVLLLFMISFAQVQYLAVPSSSSLMCKFTERPSFSRKYPYWNFNQLKTMMREI